MAVSSKDIEALWKRYSEEGVSRGCSVVQFFESNGVPYRAFEQWYRKHYTESGIIECVVKGKPETARPAATGVPPSPEAPADRGDVIVSYVTVGLSNGIRIEHRRLSYGELVSFIDKLRSLCSA